ncbi:MAG: hypothetical protein IJW40_03550 [Clostridia bacterium]|nr:hypothetical protein [Clostridia bacterium]
MNHITYQDFLRNDMTLEPFGILPGESRSTYFCTPRTSTILGWTGVDGIHYVQIKKLGEMVFAVNPYADPGRHAHPVAQNFEDFLRLLVKCGHESYLEQAHGWTWEQYENFSQENTMTAEQNDAAEQIMARFDLTPISDVYTYVKELDAAFDYSTIPYPADYWEYVPRDAVPAEREWKVYFRRSFGESAGRGERAGEEVPLDVHFSWDGRQWRVPAVYLCAKGLVVDLVATAAVEEVQSYLQKWSDKGALSPAEEYAARAESPLRDDFVPTAVINGQPSRLKSMGGITLLADDRELSPTERQALSHYGLDEHTPTLLCRIAFPWATAKKPKLRSLQLQLSRRPTTLTGEPFTVCGAGERVTFTHPIRGTEHTLSVQELHRSEMHHGAAAMAQYQLPSHSVQMLYTLSPDLPDSELVVRDVRHNDTPILVRQDKSRKDDFVSVTAVSTAQSIQKVDSESAAIAIIGGADGPTTMVVGRAMGQPMQHAAHSALTFEPQDVVTWHPTFRAKLCEDVTVQIV